MQETPIQEKQGTDVKAEARNKLKKEIFSWIRELVMAVVIVMIIKTFFFEIITVDGGSMLETLQNGDKLYVSILTPKLQGYERGDIVICYYPGYDVSYVKRVIGLPGDKIFIDDNTGLVYRNGTALEEPYVRGGFTPSRGLISAYTVPEGGIFVLGDNRSESLDSRMLRDQVLMKDVVGVVTFRLNPFQSLKNGD